MGKLSAKEGGEVPLIYVKHLAFVNGNNWSLSIVGETNIHESVPHLYYWFWEILKVTTVDAKNSAETMSTEGRFNSCLSKTSGWC